MQITETLAEGLKRQYKVVVSASDLAKRLDDELGSLQKRANIPGFRPGKVPPNLVRKMHGEALRGEALQAAVNDGVQQLLSEHKLRPANQPQVDLEGDGNEGDVGFKVALEILPTVEDIKIDDLALEKLVVASDDAAMDAALQRLGEAKGAVELLLADCYIRRDQVALISFRGREAQLLLPPTRSLTRAKRSTLAQKNESPKKKNQNDTVVLIQRLDSVLSDIASAPSTVQTKARKKLEKFLSTAQL